MITLSLDIVVRAIAQILLLGLCGYFLYKKNIVNEEGLKLLTQLLMNFLLPVFIIYHFTQQFNFERYPNWWIFPLLSFLITALAIGVASLAMVFFKGFLYKKEFMALVSFQNAGYIPLMLVSALFDGARAETLYVYIFLFLVGFNLVMWSLGVWWMMGSAKGQFKLRDFFNPPLVAMLISLFVVALGAQKFIPGVLIKPMNMLSNCVLPLAMLVVGGSLAKINITSFKPKELFVFTLAKLVLLPVVVSAVIKMLSVTQTVGFLMILEAVTPSAISLSIIARHYQVDERFISQGLLFSYIASIFTIPFFLMTFQSLY